MVPRIAPAAPAETEQLHEASLRVLEEVGVAFPAASAQQVLHDAGCVVNAETGVVKIPRDLVAAALGTAPGEVLLAGRDPAEDVRLGDGSMWLTLDGTGASTLDHASGEVRPSTLADLAAAVRLADACAEVGVVWNIVSACDVPPATEVLEELAACLRNTGKHVQGEVQRAEEVPYVLDILAAACESGRWDPARPIFSIVYCPVPPLQHEPDMLAAAVELARAGVPMCIYSMGLAGATAPVTVAGAVVQANAEILSALVLFQLLRPGLPCIYVADTGLVDMRTGAYTAAAPEAVLVTQAMMGLARRYGLPVMATGFTSDATRFSFRAGVEAGTTAITTVLMEPDLVCGAGMLAGAQVLSLPKLLLDCELYRACLRLRTGAVVDPDHLLVDLIAKVGPGGHFLAARETRRFSRGELHVPDLFLREAPGQAAADEVARAAARVDELLASHRPRPLPAGAEARIDAVVAAAARDLGGR